MLDTRGYVLHLLGRHAEALDDLNRAIATVAGRRGQVAALVRHGDRVAALNAMAAMATPLGRFAQAEEIAEQALFLLSDMAATITGAVLVSDGGYSL